MLFAVTSPFNNFLLVLGSSLAFLHSQLFLNFIASVSEAILSYSYATNSILDILVQMCLAFQRKKVASVNIVG